MFNRGLHDRQVWGGNNSGKFSVRSTYECQVVRNPGENHDLFNLIWRVKAFPNVRFTAWRIILNKIPTRFSLIRREVVVNSITCEMCQGLEETTQHLFLECSVAQRVW